MTNPRPTRRTLAILATTTCLAATSLTACSGGDNYDSTIQVYSARHYDLEEAFKEFAKEKNIKVEFLFGQDAELRERLKAEGEGSVADVYLTVDAGNLAAAAKQGLFQPSDSTVLKEAVPENLRDSENRWFGLAKRLRTIAYDPDKVKESELSTYEDLADPKWKGRLCLRTGNSSYTQSLVASMIGAVGEEATEKTVKGWADNAEIFSNDVEIIRNIDSGKCEVAIVNHYYLAREMRDKPDLGVKLFWANQSDRGVHVNLSGGGIVKGSDNVEAATTLLEWLATDGQEQFVGDNMEFPTNKSTKVNDILTGFGDFKEEDLNAEDHADKNADAVALMGRVGYK